MKYKKLLYLSFAAFAFFSVNSKLLSDLKNAAFTSNTKYIQSKEVEPLKPDYPINNFESIESLVLLSDLDSNLTFDNEKRLPKLDSLFKTINLNDTNSRGYLPVKSKKPLENVVYNRFVATSNSPQEYLDDRKSLKMKNWANLLGVKSGLGAPKIAQEDFFKRFMKDIVDASDKYDVDPIELVALITGESGGQSYAVSSTGCAGSGQISKTLALPGRYKFPYYGKQDSINVFNPKENIDRMAVFYSSLLKGFKGDQNLALLGYCSGRGNVKKAKRNALSNAYGDILKAKDAAGKNIFSSSQRYYPIHISNNDAKAKYYFNTFKPRVDLASTYVNIPVEIKLIVD